MLVGRGREGVVVVVVEGCEGAKGRVVYDIHISQE
jgi:hypothetical protein